MKVTDVIEMNEDKVDAVRQILDAFKVGRTFLSLQSLAEASGFKTADPSFRQAFKYLETKGIVKLQQSGGRSEKRGSRNHYKTVILTADLYEIKDSEFDLSEEKMVGLDTKSTNSLQQTLAEKILTVDHRKTFKKCYDCINNPVVLITQQQIPVCTKHWNFLNGSDIQW